MATDYFAGLREERGREQRQQLSTLLSGLESKAEDKRSSRKSMLAVLGDPNLTSESRQKVALTGNVSFAESVAEAKERKRAEEWENAFGNKNLGEITPDELRKGVATGKLSQENLGTASKLIDILEEPMIRQQKTGQDQRDYALREQVAKFGMDIDRQRLAVSQQNADRLAAKVKLAATDGKYLEAKMIVDKALNNIKNDVTGKVDASNYEELKTISKGLEDLANGRKTGYSEYARNSILAQGLLIPEQEVDEYIASNKTQAQPQAPAQLAAPVQTQA
jgi:hypothetical protein